jgi:sugar lactone lactonase YvrE
MRLLSIAVLAVVAVRPAAADTFLYATAATQRQVNGYRVNPDGSLAAAPTELARIETRGIKPRRVVASGCSLYVVEDDRVEVLHTAADGTLTRVGGTKKTEKPMGANDIAFSADKTMMYVPSRKLNIIGAYPLGPDGNPNFDPFQQNPDDGFNVGQPQACAYGVSTGSTYEDIAVENGFLYVNELNRVSVIGLDANDLPFGTPRVDRDKNHDGTIQKDEMNICPYYSLTPTATQPCPDPTQPNAARPPETCPLSRRDHISEPIGLVVDGLMLVTGPSNTNRLQAFTLATDGNFPPFGVDPANPTPEEKKAERKTRTPNQTTSNVRYIGITLFAPASSDRAFIYATTGKGFIDQFPIPATDKRLLPKTPNASTHKDVASTPVRNTVAMNANGKPILYVAAGESDRVEAYVLDADGRLPFDSRPFSRTDPIRGSYPNDVVVIDTTACD